MKEWLVSHQPGAVEWPSPTFRYRVLANSKQHAVEVMEANGYDHGRVVSVGLAMKKRGQRVPVAKEPPDAITMEDVAKMLGISVSR